MDSLLLMDKSVQLRNASMIIGLSGWVNAGEVSTLSVKYLIGRLGAKKLGEIASERFHFYQVQRPIVVVKDGLVEEYEPPKNSLFYWKDEKEERTDLAFLLGAEPHLDWPSYSRTVLDAAISLGVNRIYTTGGYIVDPSVITEPFVTGSSNKSEILVELEKFGVELVDYTGPTSVYSEILWQSRTRDVDVVSLWCAVPFHGQESDFKALYTLLSKLVRMVGLNLDLEDLKQKSDRYDTHVPPGTEERMRLVFGDLEKSRSVKRPSYFV